MCLDEQGELDGWTVLGTEALRNMLSIHKSKVLGLTF